MLRPSSPFLNTTHLLLFALPFSLGCATRLPVSQSNVRADHILIIKSQHNMTLLANGKVIQTYKVALGRGRGGPKQREGDHETPEGLYIIDSKNAHSRFHRALHISFPNVDDRKRAQLAGVKPGSEIMIHGIQNGLGWIGTLHQTIDWTDGCVAVTDSQIDEVWNLVPIGTPVEIRH